MEGEMNVRELIYDWEWQKLRIGLDFRTLDAAYESTTRLRFYLKEALTTQRWARLYRINNLLAATRMGLRGQQTLHPLNDELPQIEEHVRKAAASMRWEASKEPTRWPPSHNYEQRFHDLT